MSGWDMAPTILCIATYLKGDEFLRECDRQGCRVLLVTADTLRNADWPREAIDDTYYIPAQLPREDLLKGIGHVARTERIDRIVALDDFDVETAALLREHLRVPGMGDTTARYFRDKLAMRGRARSAGLLVPEFVPVVNHDQIREFTSRVAPPWILKPRSLAASVGIKKVSDETQLWAAIDALGDKQSFHVLEQFVSGDIFHVDSIVFERIVRFAPVHRYGQPPMDVAHHGGIFTTRTLERHGAEALPLEIVNARVIEALGLVRGVTHTEFIQGRHDGRIYFLETSARVGGAYIVDVIEAATGVNLWREWARLEIAGEDGSYDAPVDRGEFAGIVLSLARQEFPDTSAYVDREIVKRVDKHHHAGLIVASPDPARVEFLLLEYSRRFQEDFFATAPLPDRPTA
jgi:biotin carboxylase